MAGRSGIQKPGRAHVYILAALLFLVLAKGAAVQPISDMLEIRDVIRLNDEWEVFRGEEPDVWEYRFRIPEEMSEGLTAVLKTDCSEFSLLLDGNQFYRFADMSRMNGVGRYVIRLPENCGGGILVLEAVGEGPLETPPPVDMYLGDQEEVFIELIRSNFYALLFGLISLIVGGGAWLTAFYMRKSKSEEKAGFLWDLGSFVLVTGVWVVTDSALLLCFTNRNALVVTLSYLSFIVMPMFLLRFVGGVIGRFPHLELLSRLYLAAAALYMLNYLFPVIPSMLLLLPVHVLSLVSIAIFLQNCWMRRHDRDWRKIRKLFQGVVVFCGFFLLALAVFWLAPTWNYTIIYCFGIIVLYIHLLETAVIMIHEQVEESAALGMYKTMAFMDGMTGMENRTAFMERQAEQQSCRGQAYVVLDINDLKLTNDRYGHYEGDVLIQAAAWCIKDAFYNAGTCYRIGGDEFVVILEEEFPGQTEELLSRLRERVGEENEERDIPLSIAAGYAVSQDGSETARELYQRADANMYREKQKMKQ